MTSEMPFHDLTGKAPMIVDVDLWCLPAMTAILSVSIACPAMPVLSRRLFFWASCLFSAMSCLFSSMPLLRCVLSGFGILPVHNLPWDCAAMPLL